MYLYDINKIIKIYFVIRYFLGSIQGSINYKIDNYKKNDWSPRVFQWTWWTCKSIIQL